MIKWPNNLIDDIAKRKTVLYLGSGISAASQNDDGKSPAIWYDFLDGILDIRQDKLNQSRHIIEQLLKGIGRKYPSAVNNGSRTLSPVIIDSTNSLPSKAILTKIQSDAILFIETICSSMQNAPPQKRQLLWGG